MNHEPVAERLLAHLREHYGIVPVTATRLSVHKTYVFRIDLQGAGPWVARAFPPARPRVGVEGDAAILRFLKRHDHPAERVAADDPVSEFGGSTVLVTRFVQGAPLPDGAEKFAMMGDLLGGLHALPNHGSVNRPGGASGEDPGREGAPRQGLLAALAFFDAVDTKVPAEERERFERLRNKVRSADDGDGLPEALLHGNLLHAPDHALLTEEGPVAINWKASGRGPRLVDFAHLDRGAARRSRTQAPTRMLRRSRKAGHRTAGPDVAVLATCVNPDAPLSAPRAAALRCRSGMAARSGSVVGPSDSRDGRSRRTGTARAAVAFALPAALAVRGSSQLANRAPPQRRGAGPARCAESGLLSARRGCR